MSRSRPQLLRRRLLPRTRCRRTPFRPASGPRSLDATSLRPTTISVDRFMAPLISMVNQAGIRTVTSCQGDDEQWAYVMFADVPSAQRFMRLWYRQLLPMGYPVPTLNLDLRDVSFTTIWKLFHDDLRALMPRLLKALGEEFRGRRLRPARDCGALSALLSCSPDRGPPGAHRLLPGSEPRSRGAGRRGRSSVSPASQ